MYKVIQIQLPTDLAQVLREETRLSYRLVSVTNDPINENCLIAIFVKI